MPTLKTHQTWQERVAGLRERLRSCDLCPLRCGVNRLENQPGRCRMGALARVASYCDHHGEEPALSGAGGSGTVFLAGCNLRCVFCQNSDISQGGLEGYPEYSSEQLAEVFLHLQRSGCHNLNWVTPTHCVPQLVEALALAVSRGFTLPVVYNSNGYDSAEVLALLDGIVDIYLPDFKYADDDPARRFSQAPDYPEAALAAITEMHRQVGNLVLDEQGIAQRGVIVRHLVLPHNLAGTREAMRRLAKISPFITVSLMAQYHPCHQARAYPELSRGLTPAEYEEAIEAFVDAGMENGWAQDLHSAPEHYLPDFTDDTHPFERR